MVALPYGSGDDCISCDFFNSFESIKNTWGVELFQAFAAEIMAGALQALVVGWFVWQGLMFAVLGASQQRGQAFFTKLLWLPVVAAGLIAAHPVKGATSFVWDWVVWPMERIALKMGSFILAVTAPDQFPDAKAVVASADGGHTYAVLGHMVENQIWTVLDTATYIMAPASFISPADAIFRTVAGLVLMLPYLFVIGVFFAFLVEALFKFVSIAMISPMLLVGSMFNPTRAIGTASIRVLLGAVLTIVFASGAMGLTIKVVKTQTDEIQKAVRNAETNRTRLKTAMDAACAKANMDPSTFSTSNASAGSGGSGYDPNFGNANQDLVYACQSAHQSYVTAEDGFSVFQKQYFMLVIIGFVSILLHLGSKTLASNLSGANDGAGPAAATVAAGKIALGAVMLAGGRAAFGAGGAGTSFQSALQSLPGGDAVRNHGVLGAVPAMIGGGGLGRIPANPAAAAAQTAGKLAAASGFAGMDDQGMKRFATMIGEAINGGGGGGRPPGPGGRDRYG